MPAEIEATNMINTPQRPPVQLTLLSTILGPDLPLSLERQAALHLRYLDLKDGLWGKTVEQLNEDEAVRTDALVKQFGMEVHCFSTSIGHTVLEPDTGETAFRARHEPNLENALRVAHLLRPQVIRLLAPRLAPTEGETATQRLLREFPWIIGVYREWADRIAAAGCGILLENEARGCLLGSVTDVQNFLEALGRPAVRYIWDVQNLWQSGTFPSTQVYEQLRSFIGAVHLKGGRSDDGQTLAWAAPLEDASWPVLDIVRRVVADGAVPYICLNPSHGQRTPGYDDWDAVQRDIAFLRRHVVGIA